MRLFKTRFRDFSDIFWPAMGWRRLGRYLWHRLTRLKATPHAIALGVSFGIFASFTPLMGLHIALASFLAYFFGGNLIAAGLGTLVGNPLTFPFIWLMTYNIGAWFLGVPMPSEGMPPSLSYSGLISGSLSPVLPVIGKMLLGSIPLGAVAALLGYFPMKFIVTGHQNRRRQRLSGEEGSARKSRPLPAPAMS